MESRFESMQLRYSMSMLIFVQKAVEFLCSPLNLRLSLGLSQEFSIGVGASGRGVNCPER